MSMMWNPTAFQSGFSSAWICSSIVYGTCQYRSTSAAVRRRPETSLPARVPPENPWGNHHLNKRSILVFETYLVTIPSKFSLLSSKSTKTHRDLQKKTQIPHDTSKFPQGVKPLISSFAPTSLHLPGLRHCLWPVKEMVLWWMPCVWWV